jgi:hypothetical protein
MIDACCFICRGPHGICLTRGTCGHHITARLRQDADDRARHLYADPTGNEAVNNVMRTRKPKAPVRRPLTYPKEDR